MNEKVKRDDPRLVELSTDEALQTLLTELAEFQLACEEQPPTDPLGIMCRQALEQKFSELQEICKATGTCDIVEQIYRDILTKVRADRPLTEDNVPTLRQRLDEIKTSFGEELRRVLAEIKVKFAR